MTSKQDKYKENHTKAYYDQTSEKVLKTTFFKQSQEKRYMHRKTKTRISINILSETKESTDSTMQREKRNYQQKIFIP